jgi:hypothetical protein
MGCATRFAVLAVLAVLAAAPVRAAAAPVSGAGGFPGVLENDAFPTVSGDVAIGGTVVASPGGWSGQGPISYSYQWQDCNPTCVAIPGATASTYAPTVGDLGERLVVIVTAGNASTSYAAMSLPSSPVAPPITQVQASLSGQLLPHDPTLAVAIGLQTTRGYRLAFTAQVTGVVTVKWYLGARSQLPADRQSLVLVASGSSRIAALGPTAVPIRTTARGRALVKRSRALRLTALATLVPSQSPAVSALAPFTLT